MGSLVIIGIIAGIAIIYVLVGFTIIQQSETKVVERLGKYHRTLTAGINIIIPTITTIKNTTIAIITSNFLSIYLYISLMPQR